LAARAVGVLLHLTTKLPLARVAGSPELLETYRKKLDSSVVLFGRLPSGPRRLAVVDAPSGIRGEWIVPRDDDAQAGPVILYLHGGGYVAGSPRMYRSVTGALSARCKARVFVLDYRLAPEHPFPAGVHDAVVAYRWLLEREIDPKRIVIAGDSAGGGLAVSSLLALRDAGIAAPAGAVLIGPWLDLKTTGDSMKTNAASDKVVVVYPGESRLARAYVGDAGRLDDPAASGLYADVQGFPPLLIQASHIEVLRDDAVRFDEKARAAGVDSTLHLFDGVPHVWHLFAGLPETRDALTEIAAFVNRVTK
jgi:acetyl esterase/lipase